MSKNTAKGKGPTPSPKSPEDDLERLENQMQQISTQTQESLEQIRHEIFQKYEETQSVQKTMLEHLETLTANRLSPSPFVPTPDGTSPPGDDPKPIDIPVPPAPSPNPMPRAYDLARTPTIPQIEKLKGRSNYKTWTINIRAHAENLHVWSIIEGQNPNASQEQKGLARSLIILNVITAIQHQIDNMTATQAWTFLKERYNTRNIIEITKTVQEFCSVNRDKFNTVETFHQRLLTLERQITESTSNKDEAYHAIIAAFYLISIGRADNNVRAQIMDSLNNSKLEYTDALKQHVIDRLLAFQNSNRSTGINAVRDSNKACLFP